MLYNKSDEEILTHISKRLKKIRKDKGMSQEEVARKCDISRKTLFNIENGETYKIETLIKLLRIYGRLDLFNALDREVTKSIRDRFQG